MSIVLIIIMIVIVAYYKRGGKESIQKRREIIKIKRNERKLIAGLGFFANRVQRDISLETIRELIFQSEKCEKYIDTTTNPECFFTNLHKFLDTLLRLQKYEKYKVFKNTLPTIEYGKFIVNLEHTVNEFIMRSFKEQELKIPKNEAQKKEWELYFNNMNYYLSNSNSIYKGIPTYPHYLNTICPEPCKEKLRSLQQNVYDEIDKQSKEKELERNYRKIMIEQAKKKLKEEKSMISKSNMSRIFTLEDRIREEMLKIDLMTTNGYEFENYVADLLLYNGFHSSRATQQSGDFGIDVLAYDDKNVLYAIQCKCYSGKIGISAIQETIAGIKMYEAYVGIVITNNYFTEQAETLAKKNNILLWNRDKLETMITAKIRNAEKANEQTLGQTGANIHQDVSCRDKNGIDVLMPEAINIAAELGIISPSTIQRLLKVGYARSISIVEQMSDLGLIEQNGHYTAKSYVTHENKNEFMELLEEDTVSQAL